KHDQYPEWVQDIGSCPVLAVDDSPEILPLNTHRLIFSMEGVINGLIRPLLAVHPKMTTTICPSRHDLLFEKHPYDHVVWCMCYCEYCTLEKQKKSKPE